MKTIQELNSKWWYRFLKVVYVIILILACGIALASTYSRVGNYQDDFLVVCNYGNKSSFLAYSDKKIYINPYEDYTNSLANLPDDTKTEIQSACAIGTNDTKALFDNILNGTSDGKKLFDLNKTKVITDTYQSATMWALLSIVIIFVVFEISRRAFYYIVLGSIKPPKKL